MEKSGSMLEVLGVPDVLPAAWTADKLMIHFLRGRNGGGEVLKVLYPCYEPGQAFIVFEEPEVAARVLRRRSHVLELKDQPYHLTVKAADHPVMDFPVEATLHLNLFPNQTHVRDILRSQGFVVTDLSGDRVRVKGSFLKLRAVKASLEPILASQTETGIIPSSSSPVPKVSSGAISKYYTTSSDGHRSRVGSRHEPPRASPSSPDTSSPLALSSPTNRPASPRPDQRDSRESFAIDANVFLYAKRLKKQDIVGVLESHNVTIDVQEAGENLIVTLLGRGAGMAAHKLQSLLNDLSMSLRTQEVPLKDVDHEGKTLLERIQKNGNTHNSVLVCSKDDKLHLIGPSGESYELKQRLLGRSLDQSGRTGRTGRTSDKKTRPRSRSLPPVRKSTEGDSGAATAGGAAGGAAGYSPTKYQDDEQEEAEPKRKAAAATVGFFRRRSNSESRQKKQAGRTNSNEQDMENKHVAPKSPKRVLPDILSFSTKDIREKFKNHRK